MTLSMMSIIELNLVIYAWYWFSLRLEFGHDVIVFSFPFLSERALCTACPSPTVGCSPTKVE